MLSLKAFENSQLLNDKKQLWKLFANVYKYLIPANIPKVNILISTRDKVNNSHVSYPNVMGNDRDGSVSKTSHFLVCKNRNLTEPPKKHACIGRKPKESVFLWWAFLQVSDAPE